MGNVHTGQGGLFFDEPSFYPEASSDPLCVFAYVSAPTCLLLIFSRRRAVFWCRGAQVSVLWSLETFRSALASFSVFGKGLFASILLPATIECAHHMAHNIANALGMLGPCMEPKRRPKTDSYSASASTTVTWPSASLIWLELSLLRFLMLPRIRGLRFGLDLSNESTASGCEFLALDMATKIPTPKRRTASRFACNPFGNDSTALNMQLCAVDELGVCTRPTRDSKEGARFTKVAPRTYKHTRLFSHFVGCHPFLQRPDPPRTLSRPPQFSLLLVKKNIFFFFLSATTPLPCASTRLRTSFVASFY